MTEPERYLPMNRAELIAHAERLEAALRTACDWLSAELHAYDQGSSLCEPDAARMREFLGRAYAVIGLAPETQCPPCQLELGGKRCGDCGYPAETACKHRWYISNTATQTCYMCGAVQHGNGPAEHDPKCATASWVLMDGIAVCENCKRPVDEIFKDARSAPKTKDDQSTKGE